MDMETEETVLAGGRRSVAAGLLFENAGQGAAAAGRLTLYRLLKPMYVYLALTAFGEGWVI
jgi:hypothetical protein